MKQLLILPLFFVFVIAGCTNTPPQPDPELTFQHLPPLNMAVGGLAVVDAYAAPGREPNVEHRLPTSPEKALRRWAGERLQVRGGAAKAEFIIRRASVIEDKLETDRKLKDIFVKEQGERYTAAVEAELRLLAADGSQIASAVAMAEQATTIAEDATLNEREDVWFTLVEKLMTAFDQEMATQIRRHLSDYVK